MKMLAVAVALVAVSQAQAVEQAAHRAKVILAAQVVQLPQDTAAEVVVALAPQV
jgi:predicted secreted protein